MELEGRVGGLDKVDYNAKLGYQADVAEFKSSHFSH